jgi:hypothetical protein
MNGYQSQPHEPVSSPETAQHKRQNKPTVPEPTEQPLIIPSIQLNQ